MRRPVVRTLPPGPFLSFLGTIGVVGLTRAQRALVRVCFDAVDPIDLPRDERDAAREIFGDIDRIPPLARAYVALVKGRWVGGSWLSALRLLHLAWSIPLPQLARGERAYGLVVAPDLKLARQALSFARGAIEATPWLTAAVMEKNADSISLRRPDGTLVTLEAVAASRGGAAGRGRTLVGALLDESMFFRDQDHVVNDQDVFNALVPRLVLHAQALIISTPWTRSGLLFELFDANHGKCVTAIAAHVPTPLAREGDLAMAQALERERRRDEANYWREFGARFVDGLSSGCTVEELDRCVMHGVIELAVREGLHYGLFIDLGLRRDRSVALVVHREHVELRDAIEDVLVVDAVLHLVPTVLKPLKLERVVDEIAALARRYRITRGWSDLHYLDAAAPMLRERGVVLEELSMSSSEITARVESAISRIASARLRVVDHSALKAEILESKVERASGGRTTWRAVEGSKKHDDILSALLLAHTADVQKKFLIPAGGDIAVSFGPLQWDAETKTLHGAEPHYSRRNENGSYSPCEPPLGSVQWLTWMQERAAAGEWTASMQRFCKERGVTPSGQLSDQDWQSLLNVPVVNNG
jgi:hypothetical protein